MGKYVTIHYLDYTDRLLFELVDEIVFDEYAYSIFYLSRDKYGRLGKYRSGWTGFTEPELIVVKECFNKFVINTCVQYEKKVD